MRRMQLSEGGKFLVVLLAIVAAQGILAYRFRVFAHFDLPLICAVYYGFTLSNPLTLVPVGGVLGLLQDGLSGALLGTNAFSKTVIGFAAAMAGSRFNVDQPIARVTAVFAFTLINAVVVTGLSAIVMAPAYEGLVTDVLLAGVFNSLLALMVFGLHDWRRHAAE